MSRTIGFCTITDDDRLRSIGYGFTIADNNTTDGISISFAFTYDNLICSIALSSVAYDYTIRIAFITFTYYDSIICIIKRIS